MPFSSGGSLDVPPQAERRRVQKAIITAIKRFIKIPRLFFSIVAQGDHFCKSIKYKKRKSAARRTPLVIFTLVRTDFPFMLFESFTMETANSPSLRYDKNAHTISRVGIGGRRSRHFCADETHHFYASVAL